jgi:hypothetical protein
VGSNTEPSLNFMHVNCFFADSNERNLSTFIESRHDFGRYQRIRTVGRGEPVKCFLIEKQYSRVDVSDRRKQSGTRSAFIVLYPNLNGFNCVSKQVHIFHASLAPTESLGQKGDYTRVDERFSSRYRKRSSLSHVWEVGAILLLNRTTVSHYGVLSLLMRRGCVAPTALGLLCDVVPALTRWASYVPRLRRLGVPGCGTVGRLDFL